MHVNNIDWHIVPFRADRWFEQWRPALDRALSAGASACYLTRDIDDPLHFRQVSVWENKSDFDDYWASDELSALRQEVMKLYHKPIYPTWHSLVAEAALDRSAS